MNKSNLSYDNYRCSQCYYEGEIPCPDHGMKEEKRYFIELVIKDSETLEPVRSVSTSSDYPDSFFNYPPHHNVTSDINACVGILFSIPLKKNETVVVPSRELRTT